MVAIAVVIASKSENVLISRLFVPLSKAKLDTFICHFFTKLNVLDQSTLIQGDIVNFLFKPLDATFFLILITNKESNIVSDIQSLNLTSHILGDICGDPVSLESLESKAFDIVFAIDELFPLPLINEIPSATQVLTNLAMDSANEKVEELITKDKEKETKLKAKEKMKQLDLQRREAARKASTAGPMAPSFSSQYDSTTSMSISGASGSMASQFSDLDSKQALK